LSPAALAHSIPYGARMGLLRWLTRNWADTDEVVHADIRPLELRLPVEEARSEIAAIVGQMPRWRVENIGVETLMVIRSTRLLHMTDDISLRLEPTPEGCRIHARSQSRVGKGDLGQNRRNLLELFAALRNLRRE
jgi:uncharacterized protein (DUF1499 family)